jgi:TolB-like protein/DNA-binding winged helix-turn-helix (wHTH) protein
MDTANLGHEPDSMSLFGPFALDMRRAQLTRSGVPVALRPKTLALLSHFAAHPGRVVSKDELLAAVWPGVVVTDDSLSQCVRELRTALGDDGQGLIKTVARRGYLFEPAPQVQTPVAAAPQPTWRNRRWAWVGLGLACVLLFGGLTLAWQRQQPPIGVDQALKARRSIAVMPFIELGAGGRGYFAEAITEDLITDLAKLPDTLVIARTSAAAVAARETDARRIGRELGVRHVLSGSVRRDGAAVQVNAQFASSDNGAVLWSGRFDYPDVADWAWKRDIGARIARVLDVRMTTAAASQSAAHNGKRLDAIDATLQGQHLLRHVVAHADLLRARAHFENALAIEPDSASALTGLAQSYLSELEGFWAIDVELPIALAEQTIARALATDPDYLLAQRLTADVLRQRGDLEGALRVYQRVVADNPSEAWSHARIGAIKLRLGQPEEVAAHADVALRLSPFETTLVGYSHLYAGAAEYYLGREDAAYERMRQSAAAGANPRQFDAFVWLASLDALHGREQQAAQHAAQVVRLRPRWTISSWLELTAPVHPRLQAGRERFLDGLKKAGLPRTAQPSPSCRAPSSRSCSCSSRAGSRAAPCPAARGCRCCSPAPGATAFP